MTNVGAFDNDGSDNFRIFATNDLILAANGESGTAITIDATNQDVAVSNDLTVAGTATVTGNITGGNVSGTAVTGTLATAAQPNVTSVGTLTTLAVTGNVTSGNLQGTNVVGTLETAAQPNVTSVGTLSALTVAGDILNGQSDGVGNIGSSSVGFDTVHAQATSAQYADLAEKYTTDHEYEAGTVVVFGGDSEITQSTISHDRKVAGVISTNPAVKMNDGLDGQYLALQGRVPCKVIGPIEKGDLVVTSDVSGFGEKLDDTRYQPGCVIGKALETIEDWQEQVIEVVVGRL
jgi:hypothetical protein